MRSFRPAAAMQRLFSICELWLGRREQRLALSELDDHLLADLGIKRADAARECRQPFWRGIDPNSASVRAQRREETLRLPGSTPLYRL